jgi:hypothetical protein
MLLIIAAVTGFAGTIFFGLQGLHGLGAGGGELERVFALMSFFMLAAAVVGMVLDDGIGVRPPSLLTTDEKIQMLVGIPLAIFMTAVFLGTLLPSMYVMLPFFGVKRVIQHSRRPGELPPAPARPAPAYA